MISLGALLLAAALVGALHMSAPDHWVTLILLGRAANWSRSRLLGVGIFTAAGHVALSVLLGFLIALLGLVVSRTLSTLLTDAVGIAMAT